jgi:hypothetical protein
MPATGPRQCRPAQSPTSRGGSNTLIRSEECVTPPRFGDADDRTSAEFGIVVRRAGVTDTARWVLDLDEVFGLGERSAQAWLSS